MTVLWNIAVSLIVLFLSLFFFFFFKISTAQVAGNFLFKFSLVLGANILLSACMLLPWDKQQVSSV